MEINDNDSEKSLCPGCSSELQVPYIKCYECPAELCLHCFARGLEYQQHESNHKYTVIKNNFSLFDKDWTVTEEIKLLDALSECGVGNWADVAHLIPSQTKASCETHYTKYYMESPVHPLPAMPEALRSRYPCPVPFRPSDDPPRPSEGSALQAELSGYMPARGDFSVEYDNYAEMDLRDISFSDSEDTLLKELKLAVVQVYTNVLLERSRRKRIIRDCELINIKKNLVQNRRLEQTLGLGMMDALRVFQRLLKPGDWDMFMEAWHYQSQLQHSVKRLQEYRRAGLTSLSSARMYDRLRTRRDEQRGRRRMMTDLVQHVEDKSGCQVWLKKQAALSKGNIPVSIPVSARRAIPLDIVSLPGFEKLTDKEREMCSSVRLVPESYLDFKSILMAECRKIGYLRLAQARTLIKIDVNKTRKIYDFLLEEGHIYKDPIVK